MIGKLWSDFRGLWKVCGPAVALRWMWAILLRFPTVLRTRNLGVADLRMGEGPYRVRLKNTRANLRGHKVIAHIRELWVRDVYGLGDLPAGGTGIDLGANRGYFTAAAAGAGNRGVAVEPNRGGVQAIRELCEFNGWPSSTVQVCNAFIGGDTAMQHDAVAIPDHDGVPFIAEDEFLRRFGIDHIDYLKCDIEGSEFGLLSAPGS